MRRTDDDRLARGRYRSLAAGGVAFLLASAAIFWWQFSRLDGATTPRWDELRWWYLLLLALCLPVETLACALRIWIIARVLEPGVRLRTCITAEWAQVAVSTLTPTQSGGGPGQIYIMRRAGTGIGTAVGVMLLSCLGTMIALLIVGLYALFAGRLEDSSRLLRVALAATTAIAAGMVLLALPPAPLRAAGVWIRDRRPRRRAADLAAAGDDAERAGARQAPRRIARLAQRLGALLEMYRDDTRQFLRRGKCAFAAVCLLSLVFIVTRAVLAYLAVRFVGVEGSTFWLILETQVVVLLVEFLAPTPGGAGIVEGASLALMTTIVPPARAPYYNLVWRFTTLYLPALAGFFCLGVAVFQDARRVARRGTPPVEPAGCAHDCAPS